MFITPNIKYKGTDKLAGICGNFNGMDSDDYLKKDGTTATNDGDLGDGWANEMGCEAPRDTDFETVCAEHKDRQNWAKKGECEGHCFTLYFIMSLLCFSKTCYSTCGLIWGPSHSTQTSENFGTEANVTLQTHNKKVTEFHFNLVMWMNSYMMMMIIIFLL